jgi:hypothetical protein
MKLRELPSILPEEANPHKTDERHAQNENTHKKTVIQFLLHRFLRSNGSAVSVG